MPRRRPQPRRTAGLPARTSAGYLQCDAYAGYDELFRRSLGTIIEVGCWAHARRKFVEAEKTSPREAHEAVARIKQLYAIEHEAKALRCGRAPMSLRQEKSVPLLAALQTWLDALAVTALPKSPLGEAVTYARNQWAALNVYVTDGRLAIDNNRAERGVKPLPSDAATGSFSEATMEADAWPSCRASPPPASSSV
jgi:transposase